MPRFVTLPLTVGARVKATPIRGNPCPPMKSVSERHIYAVGPTASGTSDGGAEGEAKVCVYRLGTGLMALAGLSTNKAKAKVTIAVEGAATVDHRALGGSKSER